MVQTAEVASIEDLVRDPEFVQDPYPVYQRLREEQPVWITAADQVVVSSFELCSEVLRDAARFPQSVPRHYKSPAFMYMNPPDHERVRKLVAKVFTPRAVAALQDFVQQSADDLFNPILSNGTMELVEDVSKPLPTALISHLAGVSMDDFGEWMTWSEALAHYSSMVKFLPEQINAAEPYRMASVEATANEAEYFKELIRIRGADNDESDILGKLIAVENEGDRLTEEELLYSMVLLMTAGHHTTMRFITNAALALLNHPEQSQMLRDDRSLIPNALEEVLRYDGVLQLIPRRVGMDTTLNGVALQKDQTMLVLLGAANRDPKQFSDPETFDITRPNAKKHLGFGFGIHFCLGAWLARSEATVAINALLDLKDLRLDDPRHDYGVNYVMRGPTELNLSWTP